MRHANSAVKTYSNKQNKIRPTSGGNLQKNVTV